jgi:hypothetical protein
MTWFILTAVILLDCQLEKVQHSSQYKPGHVRGHSKFTQPVNVYKVKSEVTVSSLNHPMYTRSCQTFLSNLGVLSLYIVYNINIVYAFLFKRYFFSLLTQLPQRVIWATVITLLPSVCCLSLSFHILFFLSETNTWTFMTGKSVTCTTACANEIIPNR